MNLAENCAMARAFTRYYGTGPSSPSSLSSLRKCSGLEMMRILSSLFIAVKHLMRYSRGCRRLTCTPTRKIGWPNRRRLALRRARTLFIGQNGGPQPVLGAILALHSFELGDRKKELLVKQWH